MEERSLGHSGRAALSIEVQGVHKSYEAAEGNLQVLDGVNFAAPPGRFAAIVGPSGCGKTTLLNVISGLDPPSAGVVDIGGRPPSEASSRVAYMFQEDALLSLENDPGECCPSGARPGQVTW